MIRRTVLAALLLATAGLGTGCGAVPLPCNLAIASLPPASTLEAGDPLPGNLPMLAGPADFVPDAVRILADVNGETTVVDLKLRGDAIARLAAHTAGHTGDFMAIAINGSVAAVVSIEGQIPDGQLQISSGGLGDNGLAQQFAGCSR